MAACALEKLLCSLGIVPVLGYQEAANLSSPSGQQRGALMSFNRELCTTSTERFCLRYALQAADMISSFRSWSWVSGSETEVWSLMWSAAFVDHQWPRCLLLSVVCYWNMIIKQSHSLSTSNDTQPFNCFLQLSHLQKIIHLCSSCAGTYLVTRRMFRTLGAILSLESKSPFSPLLSGWMHQISLGISLKLNWF